MFPLPRPAMRSRREARSGLTATPRTLALALMESLTSAAVALTPQSPSLRKAACTISALATRCPILCPDCSAGAPFSTQLRFRPPTFPGRAHPSGGHQPKQLRVLCPGHVEDLTSPGAGLWRSLRALHAVFRACEKDVRSGFYLHEYRRGKTIRHQSAAGLSLQSRWPGPARASGLAGWLGGRFIYAPRVPLPRLYPSF